MQFYIVYGSIFYAFYLKKLDMLELANHLIDSYDVVQAMINRRTFLTKHSWSIPEDEVNILNEEENRAEETMIGQCKWNGKKFQSRRKTVLTLHTNFLE